MTCHQAIKTDSPHIQKLAAAAKENKPIPWIRVYRLPAFVYFSHRVHTEAGAACETCHGPVRDRDVITKEVANDMRFCRSAIRHRRPAMTVAPATKNVDAYFFVSVLDEELQEFVCG